MSFILGCIRYCLVLLFWDTKKSQKYNIQLLWSYTVCKCRMKLKSYPPVLGFLFHFCLFILIYCLIQEKYIWFKEKQRSWTKIQNFKPFVKCPKSLQWYSTFHLFGSLSTHIHTYIIIDCNQFHATNLQDHLENRRIYFLPPPDYYLKYALKHKVDGLLFQFYVCYGCSSYLC